MVLVSYYELQHNYTFIIITVSANHLPSPRTYQLGIKTTLQGCNPFLILSKRFVLSSLFIAEMLIIFVHPQTC